MFSNQGTFLNLIFSNVKFSIVYQTNWFLLLFFFVKELWHESFFILKKLLKFFLRIRIGLQIMEVVYDNWFQTMQLAVVKREQTGFNRERRFKYQLLFFFENGNNFGSTKLFELQLFPLFPILKLNFKENKESFYSHC